MITVPNFGVAAYTPLRTNFSSTAVGNPAATAFQPGFQSGFAPPTLDPVRVSPDLGLTSLQRVSNAYGVEPFALNLQQSVTDLPYQNQQAVRTYNLTQLGGAVDTLQNQLNILA